MDKFKWAYLIISIIFFIVALCFFRKKESFEILPFNVVDSIDSTIYSGGFPPPSRRDFFLVTGFESSEKNLSQIDSFICSKSLEINSILKNDSHYTIVFLKRSKITNNTHLKAHPGDYEEYSLFFDLICRYKWEDRRFLGRYEGRLEFKHTFIDCNVFK